MATSSHFAARNPVPHNLYSSMCGRACLADQADLTCCQSQPMRETIQISSRSLQRQCQARTVRTLSVTTSDTVSKVNVLCQTYRRIESSQQGFSLLNILRAFDKFCHLQTYGNRTSPICATTLSAPTLSRLIFLPC